MSLREDCWSAVERVGEYELVERQIEWVGHGWFYGEDKPKMNVADELRKLAEKIEGERKGGWWIGDMRNRTLLYYLGYKVNLSTTDNSVSTPGGTYMIGGDNAIIRSFGSIGDSF